MRRAGFGVSPLPTPQELKTAVSQMDTRDRVRAAPTEDELAAVDRDQHARKLAAFKRKLWWKRAEGSVSGTAAEFASTTLGKTVTDVEALTEAELEKLLQLLYGGSNG